MEYIIAYHCAPALVGIKPSNLVSCQKNKGFDVHSEIRRLNSELNSKDIYFEIIAECEKRVLLMVYRKKILQKTLNNSEIRSFLTSLGYPRKAESYELLNYLKKRLKNDDFPHEIGAFLGYPMHDIYGFILHKDKGCLLSGEWKVYKNPETAQKQFERFSACRKALLKKLVQGKTLAQTF